MRRPIVAVTAALVLFSASAAMSQQPAPPTDEVVVVQAPTADAVRNFVDEMAAAPRSQNQLSRWDRKLCPGVAGLRPRYAQFVIDRIAQRALDLDLDIGEPGCRANVLIVVSPDPDAVARDLVDNHPAVMGMFADHNHNSLGRRALRAFATSDAPVRWWHVNHTTGATGTPIWDVGPHARSTTPSRGGGIFEILKAYPVNWMGGGASLVTRSTRADLHAAFIIVDARRLEGIHYDFAALADYLAMVSLAQLDPDADTSSAPTILNLFAQPPQQAGNIAMTDWDVAYLHGLYDAERDRNAITQRGAIARTMGRDLSAPQETGR